MTNTLLQKVWHGVRIAGSLLLLSLVASASDVIKSFLINGTASANSDFSWGFRQTQVVCVSPGPAQGSGPDAFVALFVSSINTALGTNAAFATGPGAFSIKRPQNFQFWVSSRCPASHSASQQVTNVGGATISFNPTIQEVMTLPVGTPAADTQSLCVLAGGVILAAFFVLGRRGLR